MFCSTNNLNEEAISSVKEFHGNFIELYKDIVKMPDGKEATREYIKHSGAACIIAINENNEVIIEHQYRYSVKEVLLELPAGKIDNGENPLQCAKRELAEETGYQAKTWIELGVCLPCIAYSTEIITYFVATELILGEANLDEGEFIEVSTMPIEELINMAYNGKIKDSKTLSGLMLYLGYLGKR